MKEGKGRGRDMMRTSCRRPQEVDLARFARAREGKGERKEGRDWQGRGGRVSATVGDWRFFVAAQGRGTRDRSRLSSQVLD